MKCLCCNEHMVSVNDYSSGSMTIDIFACPKCKSYFRVSYDDGFISRAVFDKYHQFDEFELRTLKEKTNKK